VIGGSDDSIAGDKETIATEGLTHVYLNNSIVVNPVDFSASQLILGGCTHGKQAGYNDSDQCSFHGTSPYVEVNDPMPSIAYFDCKLTSSAGEAH